MHASFGINSNGLDTVAVGQIAFTIWFCNCDVIFVSWSCITQNEEIRPTLTVRPDIFLGGRFTETMKCFVSKISETSVEIINWDKDLRDFYIKTIGSGLELASILYGHNMLPSKLGWLEYQVNAKFELHTKIIPWGKKVLREEIFANFLLTRENKFCKIYQNSWTISTCKNLFP